MFCKCIAAATLCLGLLAPLAAHGAEDTAAAEPATEALTADGVPVHEPSSGSSSGSSSGPSPEQPDSAGLLARIDALEARLARLDSAVGDVTAEDAETADSAPVCGEGGDCVAVDGGAEAVDVQMYGDFQLQGQWFEARGGASPGSVSDFDLYYGEFGWDLACRDTWSGHFSLNVDDDDDSVTLFEAWGKYKNPSGFFAQMGQIALPFTNTNSYFPTYSATNDLGATTAKGIGLGAELEHCGFAAYLVNPDVEVYGNMIPEDNETDRKKLDEYCLWWDLSRREADECHAGHRLSLGYISHLGNHDFRVVEGPLSGRVPGLNVFGQYDWDANRWHALAEYAAATAAFDAANLDANEDGLGDQPAAWNFELAHNPGKADTWALGYQRSAEFLDHATQRYALMYGRQLCDIAELRLELSHGKYGEFVSDGRSDDTSFVAEFHVSF